MKLPTMLKMTRKLKHSNYKIILYPTEKPEFIMAIAYLPSFCQLLTNYNTVKFLVADKNVRSACSIIVCVFIVTKYFCA